jgi:adenosylmethionine-8-amino-7-oxononanoate aminotransferase
MARAPAAKKKRPRRRGPKSLVCGFASPASIETRGTTRLVRGRGVYVWDAQGRRYLDGLASLWNVNVGHGRREIARAIAEQTRRLEYAPTLLGFSSEPAERLAERVARMAPRGLSRVLFTSGGSDANETVIRLVRLYWRLRGRPEKIKFIARDQAYHGSSTGAASLTGLSNFHRYYEPMMSGVVRMPRPFCYRCDWNLTQPGCGIVCADELERIIEREGADTIGAFIAEPVQGVGGVVPPPPGYFERIRAICDKHDILFVVDEVITGFGRLGTPFGIQRWQAVPDMIVFAKGVTSGYLPLGGVILQEKVYETLLDAGPEFALHHGFTYSGHPVVCAAALANLDIIEREGLIQRVRKLAPAFARRMKKLERHDVVGEARCIGLMGALELVRDKRTKAPFPAEVGIAAKVRDAIREHGVIVRAGADVIAVCPPFIIELEQIDRMIEAMDSALSEIAASVAA